LANLCAHGGFTLHHYEIRYLHQCVLHGPEAQNADKLTDFKEHLLGCIARVRQFNGAREAKLMGLFGRVQW
jgi:hypothetical protein